MEQKRSDRDQNKSERIKKSGHARTLSLLSIEISQIRFSGHTGSTQRDNDILPGKGPLSGVYWEELKSVSLRPAARTDLAKPISCNIRIPNQLMSISYQASPCRADVGKA